MLAPPISVFVIENHPTVRESISALIAASRGLTLWATAESGEDALDQLQRAGPGGLPSIALVDLSMPGMDGIELIERVRAGWPSVPCVVLSAHRAAIYSG
ncbi:MAG TPA: response regulator transcription factor, partial [Rubricoccaceae bacterium]